MANYTKGEWEAIKFNTYWGIRANNYGAIRHITDLRPEDEANAHLIAAAPDMYEALKALIEHMTTPKAELGRPYLADVKRLADKALAKAEGK